MATRQPSALEQGAQLVALHLAVLEHEGAARSQQLLRAAGDDAHDIHPVRAAVEGGLRVVQAHLGVARDGAERDVGRVRDDDVEGAVELGDRVGEVGEHEPEVGARRPRGRSGAPR